jgi:hypothetical protein
LGVPVEVTVNLKVNWRKQTFNVNVTGYTTQPFRVYGSFGSAGPVDPPNFGDTGPLDINVKSAKARYTIQNLGDTAASGKLYISEKPPTQINRDNVETEASLLASVPEEDSIPPGEARHVEGQNILTPLLRQFLENDQTFYVYGLATSSGGTVNVRVTNLQVTVKAEGSLF